MQSFGPILKRSVGVTGRRFLTSNVPPGGVVIYPWDSDINIRRNNLRMSHWLGNLLPQDYKGKWLWVGTAVSDEPMNVPPSNLNEQAEAARIQIPNFWQVDFLCSSQQDQPLVVNPLMKHELACQLQKVLDKEFDEPQEPKQYIEKAGHYYGIFSIESKKSGQFEQAICIRDQGSPLCYLEAMTRAQLGLTDANQFGLALSEHMKGRCWRLSFYGNEVIFYASEDLQGVHNNNSYSVNVNIIGNSGVRGWTETFHYHDQNPSLDTVTVETNWAKKNTSQTKRLA